MSQVKQLDPNMGHTRAQAQAQAQAPGPYPSSPSITGLSPASSRRSIHPIVKAYAVGLISQVTPRLLAWIVAAARRKKQWDQEGAKEPSSHQLFQIFKKAIEPHRFPAFCGITVAGGYALQPVFEAVLRIRSGKGKGVGNEALASFMAFAVAAGGGLRMLNSRRTRGKAGRTVDLTLFAVIRALDVVIGELWHQRRVARTKAGTLTKLERFVGYMTDPAIFAISSGIIMFAWFYSPEKLPPSYNRQLNHLARVDERLIIGLRKIREGEWMYGKETGLSHLFGGLAQDNGLPYSWGDPTKVMPVPCEVIHSAETESCEIHSLRRFVIGSTHIAFPIYLTLNLLRFLRPGANRSLRNIAAALLSAGRSASFLGAFIALFWYGVCLTRTRIGPLVLRFAPEKWGLGRLDLEKACVHVGCTLSGWSIMLERRQRRSEFMFFVAPRALATLLPRRYDRKYLWIESLAFGLSTGVVFATVKHNPKRVRGVFGKLLRKVLT